MGLLISIGFGCLALAMGFLVVIFYRAHRDKEMRHDARYRVASGAFTVGSLGVGLWAFNPLSQSLGGPPLHPHAMIVASVLIIAASSALICSTAIGGSRRTLTHFLLCCAAWTLGCVLWWLR